MLRSNFFGSTFRNNVKLYDITLIVGASLFIALMAQVALYVPFSPVPISGQTLAVLLTGVLLGSKKGSLAVLAYLTEGAAGLPVFAAARGGIAVLLGPTGGYLLGFAVAAFLVGLLAEKGWGRKLTGTLAMMTLGNLVIYAFGLPWLANFVGAEQTLSLGFYPFLPGDLLKLLLATFLLPSAWKLISAFK